MMIEKRKLRNIEVYAFPSRQVLLDYIENRQKVLVAVNAEKILKDEPILHRLIKNNIAYADGVGAVMALRQKGLKAIRIPGCELWLDVINKFYKNKTFYLLGSTQDIIDKTVDKLKKEYPGINIVGYQNGYLQEGDKEKLINELKNKKPGVVFIAQGSPHQEILMYKLSKEYPALYMGLGGSFDVYVGAKKRAPKLFLKYNLEWLYRLFQEPSRAKRQLFLFIFVYLLVMKKL